MGFPLEGRRRRQRFHRFIPSLHGGDNNRLIFEGRAAAKAIEEKAKYTPSVSMPGRGRMPQSAGQKTASFFWKHLNAAPLRVKKASLD